MKNILSITPCLLDLLKVEASRMIGVNSDQLIIQYKQKVLSASPFSLDFEKTNSLGYLLGVSLICDDSVLEDSSDGIYIKYPDSSFDGLIYPSLPQYSGYNLNIFFKYLGLEGASESQELIVSYLKFSAK